MIIFKNVSYKIKNKEILKNIYFKISDNEKVLLCGKSGSGKTTIFNLLIKNINPSSGNIYVDDICINKLSGGKLETYRKKKITIILQTDDLFNHLSVMDNLKMFYKEDKIINILNKAKLSYLKDKKVVTLSGGERQRINIIKSALLDFDILLCDEITSALDSKNAIFIINFVLELFKNKTVIFITHTKEYYFNYIDHYIEIENKTIKEDKIINKKNNINKVINKSSKKSILYTSITNGFKNITLKSFIIYIVSFICFLILFNLSDIFRYIKLNSCNSYYDYNVYKIIDDDNVINANYNDIFYDYTDLLINGNIFINDVKQNNINLKPFYNNEENMFIVNELFNKKYNYIKKININYLSYYFKDEKIKVINEEGMFVTPTLYYNYKAVSMVLHKIKTNSYIYINNNIENISLIFTNNPMYISNDPLMPYLESNCYFDYLTYDLVFSSISKIVYLFALLIALYLVITNYLLNITLITKDIKKIAIYLLRGYSKDIILFSYTIPFFIYFFISLLLIIIINVLYASVFTFLLCYISTLISFYLKINAPINELLKEDYLC